MKVLKKSKKKWIQFHAVFLLSLAAVLAGCRGRESEFLAEIQTADFSEETEADGKERKTDFSEKDPGEKTQKPEETMGEEASSEDNAENGTGQPVLAEPKETEAPAEIYVDICGAVAKPGVFKLKEGSRVFQAIEAAGGYLPEAAQEYQNRAGLLSDGQQIYVPTKEEAQNGTLPETGDLAQTGNMAGNPDVSGGKVNINTAGAEELTTLTGIGATRAQAIIAYREANGPFAAVEEIMNVQGIKEGTFAKIKDEIIVG